MQFFSGMTGRAAKKLLAPYLCTGNEMWFLFKNGVDNAERMIFAAGIQAISAVVYIAAEMSGVGQMQALPRTRRILRLEMRSRTRVQANRSLQRSRETITGPSSCRISQNITLELWTKLIMILRLQRAIGALACKIAAGGLSPMPDRLK